jgi:hypothetical protein
MVIEIGAGAVVAGLDDGDPGGAVGLEVFGSEGD